MTAEELQSFLHQNIPATHALDIRVVQCNPESIKLHMPHAINRNHKNTVFGGSIALAATLCGWSAVHVNCPQAQGNIVIQNGDTRYLRPALSDLTVKTRPVPQEDWAYMHDMLRTTGKGKISLSIEMFVQNELVAVFNGKFVAFMPKT
ncbi:YiiD C-terminal domain-containing protein [Neisseria wadsworthii]|uniref:WecD protein n=1 Tax=Neisseria wadsworthii 9715 TaxID=1030841 RepID=G4CPT2_9NEIS|nr:YiiD C-terminal domain-containing protein [Neisseria wadsworthii]EGZ47439.1 WecD protein [Neisseria wadsworthii 9715]QMT34880.1 YiiD C-terminal domain-containing protein [Neisseria wadsworthii]